MHKVFKKTKKKKKIRYDDFFKHYILNKASKKSLSDKDQFYVDQFKAFKEVMESTVQKNENVRIMQHLR